MTTVRLEELREHLDEVLARVKAGETVEIAEGGEAVARIAPCAEPWEQALGLHRATRSMRDFQFDRIRLTPGPVHTAAQD